MSIYKMRTQFGGALKVLLGLIAFGFLIGAIFSFGAAPGGSGRQQAGASDVVATVNGMEIERGEFDTAWQRAVDEAAEMGVRSPLQLADRKGMVFMQLVQSRLILSAAKDMGVDVSDRKVEDEIDKAVTAYLNQNREVVLGKPGKAEKRPKDPRDDSEYRDALRSIESSVAQQEEFAKARIPEEQVRAQIAQQGIQDKLKAGIKPVTEADVKSSYNVYKLRQIFLPLSGLPKEQVSAKAKKIHDAATRGGDFAKLANENSQGPSKTSGGETEYSFDNRWTLPQQLRDKVERMKPGDVSPVIETPYGLYIVKLESVTPKPPAKLDKKTTTARRKEIQQDREMTAQMAFQENLDRGKKVKVMDPELEAYWAMFEAQRSFSDKAAYDKKMKLALTKLKEAVKEHPNNTVASAKLAQMLDQQGKTEEAIRVLYPMLEGENAATEGADLRMLLGDMLMKKGEKDKALEQYKIASEVAPKTVPQTYLQTHQELMAKFQELSRPDLVAAEQKLIDQYNEQLKAMEKKAAKPAPSAPKPGG